MIAAEHCSGLLRYNCMLVTCPRCRWEITIFRHPLCPARNQKVQQISLQELHAGLELGWGDWPSPAAGERCCTVPAWGGERIRAATFPLMALRVITITRLALRALFLGRLWVCL